MVQLSHLYIITRKTIALTIWTFVGKVMSLLFNPMNSACWPPLVFLGTGGIVFITGVF